MKDSLERYGDCRGCDHYNKRPQEGFRMEIWCAHMHRAMNSATEFFDDCSAKKPIEYAEQDLINFGDNS